MSAAFKIEKTMPEVTELLKALDTKFENRPELALTILVDTSLLCVYLLVSRDTVSLKMVPGEIRSNENVLSLSKVSLIICMLGWFLYFRIVYSAGSLIFETSLNKSSLILMLSSLTTLLKKVLSFSAISMSQEMMLLLLTSVSFAVPFSEKGSLTIFQKVLLSLMSFESKLLQ